MTVQDSYTSILNRFGLEIPKNPKDIDHDFLYYK